jgi:hypothetical protein
MHVVYMGMGNGEMYALVLGLVLKTLRVMQWCRYAEMAALS